MTLAFSEVEPGASRAAAPEWTTAGRLAALWRRLTGVRGPGPDYWLTRFLILRLLGLVYVVAFVVILNQWVALLGPAGLTPADRDLALGMAQYGSHWNAFWHEPTLFWWVSPTPGVTTALAGVGLGLAILLLLGFGNALSLLVLWALYLSFVTIGQVWYGFGWETQLGETGFLAIFLCPLVDPRPFPRHPPPVAVIWLYRWLIMRIMWGAGLIKMRGDECWRNLTCLDYHYETQPLPNPLSAWWHHLPHAIHALGVVFNHLTELVAPFLVLGPRRLRLVAGLMFVAFQTSLILSGNLSFLNYLTIVPALACFDDRFLARVLRGFPARRAAARAEAARPSRLRAGVSVALLLVVTVLSVPPVANLLSSHQIMNTSFDPFRLVNTYGAFGSVGKVRDELIIEGTDDSHVTAATSWRPYELHCYPGDVWRTPCWASPYHYRLDWLMWFAAMSTPGRHPWLVHLVYELLRGQPEALSLLANNPFPSGPPRFIRIQQYRYSFAGPDDPPGLVWRRTFLRTWLPALSADDPVMLRYLRGEGLID